MLGKFFGAAAFAATLIVGAPASAKIMQVDLAGVGGTYGYDFSHAFGVPENYVNNRPAYFYNLPFTFTFTYDSTISRADGFGYASAFAYPLYDGKVSPFISAALTINGVTKALDVSAYGRYDIHMTDPPYVLYQSSGYGTATSGTNTDNFFFADSGVGPHGAEEAFFATLNCGGCLQVQALAGVVSPVYSQFDVTSYRVSEAQTPGGAVPEPAAWSLMIAGFGLAGAALRRRRVRMVMAS